MEFRLIYRGRLPSNADPRKKHEIRCQFHPQLRDLWQQIPLNNHRDWLQDVPKAGEISIIRPLRGFRFAPLVNDQLKLFAEIDIIFLRPGEPGAVIKGGDIDNRLKTLFDALRCPLESQEIPNDVSPQAGEDPFFCLLADDCLISRVSVSTDRLLASSDQNEVHLVLHVTLRGLAATWGNLSLIQ